MRFYTFATACALLALSAPVTASAASWSPATATMVTSGVTSKSTFVVQAYVTLPTQCDSARIRTLGITSQLHRSFIVEQMPPSGACAGKTMYKCSVVSPTFNLPMQHKFEVESKGKTWEVELGMHAPQPMEPMCKKG
ncbi:MAG: hypothetical protein JO146_09500 [Candidatus Eremiobacteraeota bacterium]|nr:hypothetical protein [Candidatus Eremiobacteraeota bacterium]